MRSLRAAVAALILAPVLVLVAPGAAMACSCAEADVAQFVGFADTVAVGELTSIQPSPGGSDGLTDSGASITYNATVQAVFKGEPDNLLAFQSAAQGTSCGLEGMAVGRDYVFFVRDGQSGLCDGTALASPDLVGAVESVTGPGQDPVARAADPATGPDAEPGSVTPSAVTEQESSLPTALPWIALVASVVTVGLGWLLWTRRARND